MILAHLIATVVWVPLGAAPASLDQAVVRDSGALSYLLSTACQQARGIQSKVPKRRLAALVNAYKTAARKEAGAFRGADYLKKVGESTFTAEADAGLRNGRVLGVILRRTADGSWPTVHNALKKVITAYNPPLAQELGATL